MKKPPVWILAVSLAAGCSGTVAGGDEGSGGTQGSGSGGSMPPANPGGTPGGSGSGGTGPVMGSGGTAGPGGTSGASGAGTGGTVVVTGAGGVTGTGGVVGTGTGGSTGGSTGSTGPFTCRADCGTHRWACWPMPNPPSSGLPNPASYTDLGDGTVRDNVTCLVWQKTVSAMTYTVATGRTYCASLGTGWRLATRIELSSIDDFTQTGAKTDPTAFPGTPRAFYKSGSEWVLTTRQIGAGAGTDFGWAYNFSDGIASNARSAAIREMVRCVKGGADALLDATPGALSVPPANQYTVIATGEVQDNYTGLIWQQAFSPATMAWAGARTYCAGLGLNGHTWRVPSIRELSTLVDEAQVAPSINRTMFPGTRYGSRSNNWYWGSHLAAGQTAAAWAINFDDGFTGFNSGATSADWNFFTAAWVRCVR